MPDALTRYVDELLPDRVRPFDDALDAAGRRRTGRRLRAVAAVVVVAGLAVWVGGRGDTDVVGQVADGPPDRIEVDGRDYFLNVTGGGLSALRQSDETELVASVGARVTGLRPECRHYPAVRVVEETPDRVRLAVDSYIGQVSPEPECPQVRGDLLERTVRLAAPLAARDVLLGEGTQVLNVDDRTAPGRTPLPGTRSCAAAEQAQPSNLDYAHFVRHDGRSFVSRDATAVPPADRGAELGRVTCTLSGSYTPVFPGTFADGVAAYLEVGTPWFAVRGRDDAVAAEFDGKLALFVHDPSLD